MRKTYTILMAAVLAATSLFIPTTPASAALGDVVCLPSALNLAQATYSPAINLSSQTINWTLNGTLNPCVSLSVPSITSGTYTAGGTATLSCISGGNFSGSINFTWSDGSTSTVTILTTNVQFDIRLAAVIVFVLAGQVTGGRFTGDTGVITVALLVTPADALACLLGIGVSSSAGLGQGTFA